MCLKKISSLLHFKVATGTNILNQISISKLKVKTFLIQLHWSLHLSINTYILLLETGMHFAKKNIFDKFWNAWFCQYWFFDLLEIYEIYYPQRLVLKSITFCPVWCTALSTTNSYPGSLETQRKISPNFYYLRLIAKIDIIFEPANFTALKIFFLQLYLLFK